MLQPWGPGLSPSQVPLWRARGPWRRTGPPKVSQGPQSTVKKPPRVANRPHDREKGCLASYNIFFSFRFNGILCLQNSPITNMQEVGFRGAVPALLPSCLVEKVECPGEAGEGGDRVRYRHRAHLAGWGLRPGGCTPAPRRPARALNRVSECCFRTLAPDCSLIR